MYKWPCSKPWSKDYRGPRWQCFFVFVAGVIPTQNEKTQEGDKLYRLWFVLDSTGSAYSAFCRCKGGADQGCRHLGATLFELGDFLSNQRNSVTAMSAYCNPKPTPTLKPVPMSEMKVSQSSLMKKKRKKTPYDVPGLTPLILDP